MSGKVHALMSLSHPVILIHAAAPHKPAPGAPCNGCGVCCLLEPCPLGMLLSKRRRGACLVVRWDDAATCYRCGALTAPLAALQHALPRSVWCVLPWLTPVLVRGAKRWIAAGQGCDSTVEAGR